MPYDRSHSHSLDDVVGYRVRQTIRAGVPLVGKELVVLGNVDSPCRYLGALDLAKAHRRTLYRTGPRARRVVSESEADRPKLVALYKEHDDPYVRLRDYACVDSVYACGCVWGDDDYPPDVLAAVPRDGYWYQPNGER